MPIPHVKNVMESIRNLFFHVPMWFTMTFLFTLSVISAILYLNTQKAKYDAWTTALASVAMLFGLLGLTTGMLWAKYAWNSAWSNDPKQVYAAISLLIYVAFFILRGSIADDKSKAKVSAVYNVFAYAALIPLIFILPRMQESLHPGAEGNPGFNNEDVDSQLQMVFYPAVIGWILLGVWLSTLRYRFKMIENNLNEI
ncbi:MAG: cytochrome c biogenesis protein CcsA [Bacteroidetes bacterium]|nr:cytochrome c biogenesis protein CcsA [Bacteroidota bacterium]